MDSADVQAEQPQPIATPPPSTHPAASSPLQYEFSEKENSLFLSLASRMSFVGLFTMATGFVVIGVGVYTHNAGTILSGALDAVMGIWTHRSSVAFRHIAETRGSDISHLMHALRDLKRLFTVILWLCILSLLAAIVTVVYLLQ